MIISFIRQLKKFYNIIIDDIIINGHSLNITAERIHFVQGLHCRKLQ